MNEILSQKEYLQQLRHIITLQQERQKEIDDKKTMKNNAIKLVHKKTTC